MSKFELKFTNLKIKDTIAKITKDKKKMIKLGKIVLKQIKADSWNGRSFDGKKFPGLANSTIEQREYLEIYNPTSPEYKTERSNVTITGQLIEKIKVHYENREIVIEAKGKHSPYKGKYGRYKTSTDFSVILNGLWKLNRRIMGLSKKSKEQVIKEVKREFRRGLRKQ